MRMPTEKIRVQLLWFSFLVNVVCIFGLNDTLPASQTGCITGSWSGRKVYRVERFIKVNYYAALVHCTTHGGRLASVESLDENKLVKEAINKSGFRNGHFWTSGTNLPQGQWVWMSSGAPVLPDMTDWWPGQPDNAYKEGEHCLEYWEIDHGGYKWNDLSCLKQHYPICEYFVY